MMRRDENGNQAGLDALQRMIGYVFTDETLLQEAITTSGYAEQHETNSYSRLEFLGDAVAKLIIADLLFLDEPAKSDEEMTKERNILESNKVFAALALDIGLDRIARSNVPLRPDNVKVLASLYESLIGAVYVDSRRKMDVVKHVLLEDLMARRDEFIEGSSDQYKNQFLERVQQKFGFTPHITVDHVESGPDHDKRFGATGLLVLHPTTGRVVLDFSELNTGIQYKRQKDAEKALMKQALEEWNARMPTP